MLHSRMPHEVQSGPLQEHIISKSQLCLWQKQQGLITLAYLNTSDHVASNQLLKHLLRLVGGVPQQIQQQLNVKDMQCQLCMLRLQVQI